MTSAGGKYATVCIFRMMSVTVNNCASLLLEHLLRVVETKEGIKTRTSNKADQFV